MSTSRHDEQVLAEITSRVTRENPDLVARFALFERLVREEGPPPRELPRKAWRHRP
ncbi:DUF3040 domain-containing protein [Actinomadura rupiterrae]|uniref:DUF3040 domain-containing protein n=1 Tax=Actinomadura rupiterrae TaxID=559627 RepID=UPI0020A5E9F7|nr:DUF3040 domain-containing protein [Actinomadura rupiterrae]MCP2342838.1 hypothetical protein [Actinomadura rupiterrae]